MAIDGFASEKQSVHRFNTEDSEQFYKLLQRNASQN